MPRLLPAVLIALCRIAVFANSGMHLNEPCAMEPHPATDSLLPETGITAHPVAGKHFDGPYAGLAAGSQNLFGGSLVDGVDVLAQSSRFVAEISAGFRKQLLGDRLLIGIEGHVGFTDGNLVHHDPEKQLYITYQNNTQSGIGLNLGFVAGRRKNALFYLYANETKRKFEVSVREVGSAYRQEDKQGMLRYGIGVEWRVWKGLNLRCALGGLCVDFGDLVTNIDVEDKIDVMAGAVYQF